MSEPRKTPPALSLGDAETALVLTALEAMNSGHPSINADPAFRETLAEFRAPPSPRRLSFTPDHIRVMYVAVRALYTFVSTRGEGVVDDNGADVTPQISDDLTRLCRQLGALLGMSPDVTDADLATLRQVVLDRLFPADHRAQA